MTTPGMGRAGDIIPKGYQKGQLQNYTPEQMRLFERSLSNVGPDSYLSRLAGGDQSLFEEMEAPAHRQFNATLGNIASRFSQGSGRGSLGSRRGSGFQNSTTAAGSNFAQELAAQRQALQRQAIMDLHGMSSDLLDKRPYDRALFEKPQKQQNDFWGNFAQGIGGAIPGAAMGFATGGPPGAAIGAGAGFFSNWGKKPSGPNFTRTYGGIGGTE